MGLELTRRGFLQAILAAGTAPAICKAANLMKVSGIIVPENEIILPDMSIEFLRSFRSEFMDTFPGGVTWVSTEDIKGIRMVRPVYMHGVLRPICDPAGPTPWD
jgi:hypothetical protein